MAACKLTQVAEVRNSRRDRTSTRDGIGSVNISRPPNCLSRERELRASLTTDPLEVERCNYYVAAVTRRRIRSGEPSSLSFSLEKQQTGHRFAAHLGNRRCKRMPRKKKEKMRPLTRAHVINAIALNTRTARSTVPHERLRAFVSVDTQLSMVYVSI